MFARTLPTAALVMIVAAGTFPAKADAESPSAPPAGKMLLLRNGSVIEGNISRVEGFFLVELPNGQIRVKQSEVELVCRDLEDGYRRKRARIQIGNLHHHLELARWCLRHELFGRAAVELAEATIADRNNPKIELLRRRLRMAMNPPSPSESDSPPPAGPSNEELDRMVRNLPPKAVETFTQSVQPVLMNNCMGSGCHGGSEEAPMPLFRVSRHKSPSRRMTQRNLHSVMQFVDRRKPSASRLLACCVGPHGPAKRPVFGQRQGGQYKRLLIWTLMLAGRPTDRAAATVSMAGGASEKKARQSPTGPAVDEFDPKVFDRHLPPTEKTPPRDPQRPAK